jgi:predicted GNAT superfamily acetyltransferase
MRTKQGAEKGRQTMSEAVVVRNCHALEEFHACVELQRQIWGEEPLEVEPATMFIVAKHTGGQVLGAFAGDELIGFTLAVAGVREGECYLHSHMTGIKEGFRDRGVGRALKALQREEALGRGIRLIEWTFDPLELRNAHFNLNRLGAVCSRYLPNLYGVTTSPLHRGLATDRLLAQWRLDSSRVMAAIGDTSSDGGCGCAVGDYGGSVTIAVPQTTAGNAPGLSTELATIQGGLRSEFLKWFARGYVATALRTGGNVPAYILEAGAALEPRLRRAS